jgi:hypothetical protein
MDARCVELSLLKKYVIMDVIESMGYFFRDFIFLFSPSLTSLYAGAKYFNFLINEESCDNNNDNAGNYADIVVVNEKSSADDNVARRSVI